MNETTPAEAVRTESQHPVTGGLTGGHSAEKVRQAFVEALDLPGDTNIEALEIGVEPHWDSVGHMALVAELESRFGITLETDDMIDMSSYAKALEILRRYGIEV
jgi:acyl carrier protein